MSKFIKNIETILKEYKFSKPPILIGGKALEYYGIRKGHDYDFIICKKDYKELLKKFKTNKKVFPSNMVGVQDAKNNVDYFAKILIFDYEYFVKHAKKLGKILISSKEDLILLKAITGFYEDPVNDDIPPPSARKKSFADLEKIIASYGRF